MKITLKPLEQILNENKVKKFEYNKNNARDLKITLRSGYYIKWNHFQYFGKKVDAENVNNDLYYVNSVPIHKDWLKTNPISHRIVELKTLQEIINTCGFDRIYVDKENKICGADSNDLKLTEKMIPLLGQTISVTIHPYYHNTEYNIDFPPEFIRF